jgi:hypothetical protein
MEEAKQSLVLSPEEIVSITHRKRPAEQLRDLKALGIPATRRFDNTVCVLRADVTSHRAGRQPAADEPRLKSSRQ